MDQTQVQILEEELQIAIAKVVRRFAESQADWPAAVESHLPLDGKGSGGGSRSC